MPGNPLVRFDEGRVGRTTVSPSLLLYRNWCLSKVCPLDNRGPRFAPHFASRLSAADALCGCDKTCQPAHACSLFACLDPEVENVPALAAPAP